MSIIVAIVMLVIIGLVGTKPGQNANQINDYADRESIFRARLLQNYDRHVIPRSSDKSPLNCTVTFHPMRLRKADFDDGEIEMIIWIELVWNDYRLQWDADSSFGVQKFAIPRSEIWQPDLILLSGTSEPVIHGGANSQAYVYPTGDVAIVPSMKIRAYCNDKGKKLNDNGDKVHWMQCDLRFGSGMHDVTVFNLIPGKVVLETLYPISMTKTSVDISKPRLDEKYMDCCPEPFRDIVVPVYLSHMHDEDKKQ